MLSLFTCLVLLAGLFQPGMAFGDEGDDDDEDDVNENKNGKRIRRAIIATAFEDLNANGKRDAGEPNLGWAYFKLTEGGSWFVCGYVGPDGTMGVPVRKKKKKKYILMPIGAPGYRTTTPYIKVSPTLSGLPDTYNNWQMGFVKDPTAPLETCDHYNPPRSAPPKK